MKITKLTNAKYHSFVSDSIIDESFICYLEGAFEDAVNSDEAIATETIGMQVQYISTDNAIYLATDTTFACDYDLSSAPKYNYTLYFPDCASSTNLEISSTINGVTSTSVYQSYVPYVDANGVLNNTLFPDVNVAKLSNDTVLLLVMVYAAENTSLSDFFEQTTSAITSSEIVDSVQTSLYVYDSSVWGEPFSEEFEMLWYSNLVTPAPVASEAVVVDEYGDVYVNLVYSNYVVFALVGVIVFVGLLAFAHKLNFIPCLDWKLGIQPTDDVMCVFFYP